MKLRNLFAPAILSATLLASAYAAPAVTSTAAKLDPAQVQQIQQIIHDYLLQNPQLIVEVVQKLQTQQESQMQQQALKSIQANTNEIFNDANSPVVGNAKGAVTLVEFFDYQCPHCKAMEDSISQLVEQDKNLKVILKEFPIFPGSLFAAQAALAAQMQGKYWPLHNALMAANNPLSKEEVLAAAKKVGLNVDQLQKDMNSETIKQELKQNQELAQKLGLPGTPAFIVQSNSDKNKTFFVPGQVEPAELQALIKKAS